MKAIQVDEEDISFKTSSTYASAFKRNERLCKKIRSNDFISKNNLK